MAVFVVRRLVHSLFLMLGASVLVFGLLHLVPGDPASTLAGIDATPEEVRELRHRLGLDLPLPAQYLNWLTNALHGDLGVSYINNRSVAEQVAQRWQPTVELALISALLSPLIALPMGVIQARRRGRGLDTALSTYNAIMIAVPAFWFGIVAILVFGLYLDLLPVGGYASLTEDPVRAVTFLILPVLTLALHQASVLARFVRSSVIDVLGEDHVRTARSKGVRERHVVRRHALRNALVPVVTLFGIQFGNLLGGVVIIEAVFSWPGLGRLVIEAINNRDYHLVQGCLIILAGSVLVVNLLTDLTYGFLDPRIRIGQDGAKG